MQQVIAVARFGPLAIRVRNIPWRKVVLVIGCSLLVALVMVTSDGNMIAGGALLGLLTMVAITIYRVEWGFYLFFFLVLLFDQYGIPGFPTITTQVGYFLNLNAIGYLPKFEQGIVTPMELQLAFIVAVWFITAVAKGKVRTFRVALKGQMLLFYSVLIASIIQGLSRNGDLTISLWETRSFFYMGIMMLFVPQVIQTEAQVRGVVWAAIAGITIKALQGVQRFAALGFTFGSWPNIYETMTNHEDPVFIITLVILLLGLLLFGEHGHQRRVLIVLMLPFLVGYVAAQRRAAYASLMAALGAFTVLVPNRQRKIILSYVGIFVVLFGVYLAAYWESYSRLGSIAQQFKATVTDEGSIRGDKDVKSTLYRKIENYNLGQTFQDSPEAGIGFGRAYDKVMTMYGSGFALGDYIAHNQILWIFMKMGIIGGFIFWFFFNSYLFYSSRVFQTIADPYLKAVCAVCVVAVINQFVVSYVDMQLTYYRNMVYLGILMGLVPVLNRLDEEKRKDIVSEGRPQNQ